MSMTFPLKGRRALITGASSGIGAHLAKRFAAAGADVALAARRTDRLEALKAEIEAAGGRAAAIAMDAQSEESVAAAFDDVERKLGGVDSVVVNAGINREGLALDMSAEDFEAVAAVNLTGVFLTSREAAKRMIAADSKSREHGRIVIISSITAYHTTAGVAANRASKAGALQLGKPLAREWANKGVCVNVVCPGYIETDLNRDWFASEGGKKQIARWPRRRLLRPDDLDPIVSYLASDASARVTGAVFTVDDGQTL